MDTINHPGFVETALLFDIFVNIISAKAGIADAISSFSWKNIDYSVEIRLSQKSHWLLVRLASFLSIL